MVKIYNSLTKKTEELKTIQKNEIGIYCCGPTVYNFAHIGNMRTYIFEDLLKKMLEASGYKVKHVMNITDVGHLSSDGDEGEDKMLKSAREKGQSVWDIANFYTDAFMSDCAKLNIKKPNIVCKATDHINEMIAMISKIEENGYAYKSGGNLYYDSAKDVNYGILRGYGLTSDDVSQSRVASDSAKKNKEDFVLWFTQSKFNGQAMIWDSPWGSGYPGWHIECSAMSDKYLGANFDIHCGGVDHISIHHTNEIAQGYASNNSISANYWVHGEFLMLDKGKMSKSSGEFLTIDKLEELGFSALDYRYFCLTAHYRKQLTFHDEAMTNAKISRKKLNTKALELKPFLNENASNKDVSVSDKAKEIYNKFLDCLKDDLNVAEALAVIWVMLKNDDLTQQDKAWVIFKADEILSLSLFNKEEIAQEDLSGDIENLISERTLSKKNKDFKRADEIRDILLTKGIELKDTANGVEWRRV